ncbi:uncharacterized protein LOC125034963 [Penaeus chinensis]|uniref:uncharacterized protein LOC125034963 n=1 Tax=Penaeus chinensis TaxID=139456 RepID=UPI001FB6C81E|nr:uncharacterized protein LOC125034963 [Penaeus chinensis]
MWEFNAQPIICFYATTLPLLYSMTRPMFNLNIAKSSDLVTSFWQLLRRRWCHTVSVVAVPLGPSAAWPGTPEHSLLKQAQATQSSGTNLHSAAQEDLNDWIAVMWLVMDFFNRINLIYGDFLPVGPKFEYSWADGG